MFYIHGLCWKGSATALQFPSVILRLAQNKRRVLAFIWFIRNSVMVMAEHYFARVPQELVRMIANHLSDFDKIALHFAYPDLFIECKYVFISRAAKTEFSVYYNNFLQADKCQRKFCQQWGKHCNNFKVSSEPQYHKKAGFQLLLLDF